MECDHSTLAKVLFFVFVVLAVAGVIANNRTAK